MPRQSNEIHEFRDAQKLTEHDHHNFVGNGALPQILTGQVDQDNIGEEKTK